MATRDGREGKKENPQAELPMEEASWLASQTQMGDRGSGRGQRSTGIYAFAGVSTLQGSLRRLGAHQ